MSNGPKPPNSPTGTDRGIDWEQTLAQHAGWLRAVIANRLRGADRKNEVDEVMQEVALAAIKSPADSIDPTKLGAWLYQVAVRQSLMFRRKAGRRRKLVDNAVEHDALTTTDKGTTTEADPLVWLLAVERAELIRESISNLHRRDREILMLKYEQGWSYHKLVEHLGISHSAVEARLHRARKRLRQELTRRQLVENKKG